MLWGFTAIFGRLITLARAADWRGGACCWSGSRCSLIAEVLARRAQAVVARQLAIYAGIGVLVALHWLTFYGSIKLSNASVGATCMALMPVLMAFIEPFIVRRRFDPRELLFGLAVIPGVLLVIGGTPDAMRLGIASACCRRYPLRLRRVEQALHRARPMR